jgi:hypothetical protein
MGKTLQVLVLISCATWVQAVPIAFTDTTYENSAFAQVGSVSRNDVVTSPSVPRFAQSIVIETGNVADSFASAEGGRLRSQAEAQWLNAAAPQAFPSAVANARFQGTFVAPADPITILLDFLSTGTTMLSLQISSGGAVVLHEQLFTSGIFQSQLLLSPGATSTFDLLMTSEASLPGPRQTISEVASVTYSAEVGQAVPEPGTMALLVIGLMGVLGRRAR